MNMDDLMKRHCVCGAEIPANWRLCANCLAKYGSDRDQWPDWLDYLVTDHQREWNARRFLEPLPKGDFLIGTVIA